MSDEYVIYIRRGVTINTDPQRRCYNGCHFSSETHWEPWELWLKEMTFQTYEKAEHSASLFRRENQQLKAVKKGEQP